jgi:oligogalacturonide lyase
MNIESLHSMILPEGPAYRSDLKKIKLATLKASLVLNLLLALFVVDVTPVNAQPLLQTGGKKMPDEWIDQDTRHKVVRLSRKEGRNASFYFHNNPFIGNRMVFYSTDQRGKQIYTVDLGTYKIEQVTNQSSPMTGGSLAQKHKTYTTR